MTDNSERKPREPLSKKRKREGKDKDRQSKRHRSRDERNTNGEGRIQNSNPDTKFGKLQIERRSEISLPKANTQPSKFVLPPHHGTNQQVSAKGWMVSKPIGGRMANIDPIITENEKYLILSYHTSIQVYSTEDSLLICRIALDDVIPPNNHESRAPLAAAKLSRTSPNLLWASCQNGLTFTLDWTTGSIIGQAFYTRSGTALDMDLLSVGKGKRQHEIVIVSERNAGGQGELVAYDPSDEDDPAATILSMPQESQSLIWMVQSTPDSKFVIGAAEDSLVFCALNSRRAARVSSLKPDSYHFKTSDVICALDVRVSQRAQLGKGGKSSRQDVPVVDVIAGGARGAIYHYHDLLSELERLTSADSKRKSMEARKFHWHRRAVHSVKWSRDGNYMVSGGSENVLVLWQMDTLMRDYLPHLAGTVENITVSPSGSSYAVHLDDNSTIVISTAEMKPTTYIAGLQSATISYSFPKDMIVQRVWARRGNVRPCPTAINPASPALLHLCVGNSEETSSAPLLQTFDLEVFRSVSKHALARTQPTDVNFTSDGYPISEPKIVSLTFSYNGKWLATVDEWLPPERDAEAVVPEYRQYVKQDRLEIHLKFWEVGEDNQSFALVSRINSPHMTNKPEAVLDIAADGTSTAFASIGNDGVARIWRPRIRQQDGITVKGIGGEPLHSWGCGAAVCLRNTTGPDLVAVLESSRAPSYSGSLAFSEDGSALFAAFGARGDGRVYIINPQTGSLSATLNDLWTDDLRCLRLLSPYVVTLSTTALRVHDIVSDELQYGIDLSGVSPNLAEFSQLAVDYKSKKFAVTIPWEEGSEVAVFSPEESYPLLQHVFGHKILSLATAMGSSGFIALDETAQLWPITEAADPSAITLAKPLEDMQLDSIAMSNSVKDGADVLLANGNDDGADSEGDASSREDMDVDDDDDEESTAAVVNPQKLSDIFEAAPAFALPSVEDMFYKVANLIASKPLAATSA